MLTRYIVCDVSTAPIDGVESFIEPGDPPGNYTKPESIAKWKEEARVELAEKAGLDLDLARITSIGYHAYSDVTGPHVYLCHDEDEERSGLQWFSDFYQSSRYPLVGFNSLRFDWPMLMRRALYLGVKLEINTDRYRSSNIDVSDVLTFKGTVKAKSLNWYCRRLGWTDLCEKPLSGADESKVFQTGAWDLLEASVKRDVAATHRLGLWARALQPETPQVMSLEQEMVGF